jgi:Methyltransferase domain
MIEVGSGFSSLLTADVNRRFLDGRLDFRCIEPYPRPFLNAGVDGIAEVVVARAQQVQGAWFADRLAAGDVLFIDSSHVVKTGSDAVHLYLHVLPLLPAGVIVHVHDVFLPFDYPRPWVLQEGRSWNEQYLVQALLVFGDTFEVLFGSTAAATFHPELMAEVLGHVWMGGSLWLRKRR